MARKMKLIAAISVLLTVVCVILSHNQADGVIFSMAITFGTISYHFVMRLVVGTVINMLMNNRANYRARWFQVSEAEYKLYQKLKVKAWKRTCPLMIPPVLIRGFIRGRKLYRQCVRPKWCMRSLSF